MTLAARLLSFAGYRKSGYGGIDPPPRTESDPTQAVERSRVRVKVTTGDDMPTLKEFREAWYFTRAAVSERSSGRGRMLGQRTRAWFLWKRAGLQERLDRSFPLAIVSELGRLVRRTEAIRLHKTHEGVLIKCPPEIQPQSPLACSYTRICSLSMQELRAQFPWFGLLDILPATQVFLRGAQWASRNPGWNSDTRSKDSPPSPECINV